MYKRQLITGASSGLGKELSIQLAAQGLHVLIQGKNQTKLDNLYDKISEHLEEFHDNHKVFVEKGNKAAGARARKAIGEVKKLVTEYRKASVESSK